MILFINFLSTFILVYYKNVFIALIILIYPIASVCFFKSNIFPFVTNHFTPNIVNRNTNNKTAFNNTNNYLTANGWRKNEISEFKIYSRDNRNPYYPEERFYKMITDKYSEVDQLIEQHKDQNDKLQLRLNYLQCTSNLKLSDMLSRNSNNTHHKLCVIADMKRRTPTHNPRCDNNVLSYTDAGEVALNMASVGFDVIFVNVDQKNYGGHINDLNKVFLNLRKLGRTQRPAIVMKDIILHPIQIAQAVEMRADGVILNAAILGNALKDLLTSCITMGIEAIVEVHTTADALRSAEIGFTNFMINQWDRIKNILYPTRALEIKEVLPEYATTIAAGGIMTMEQVHMLALAGIDAVCFGRRLVYPDVPDFINQVKSWKGPSKPILKLSKNKFFSTTPMETTNGDKIPDNSKINIKLSDNHLSLLNEMNYFYFGKGNEVKISDEIEQINKIPEYKIDYEKELTDDQKSREITINIGTPTTENSAKKVTDITRTIEGQDEDFDYNIHKHNKRMEMFMLKWFVEKKKWIKENISSYENEDEASRAYELKKAIEMYNHFRYVTKPAMDGILTQKEIVETEEKLFKNLKDKYESAPKENGKVKLNFDNITTTT
uniref:indole-3-glycerol-phosphate synthase n=1 Tax=Theileria annulata TaxID=5874 RepID=A0A3B0MNP5_THEAN